MNTNATKSTLSIVDDAEALPQRKSSSSKSSALSTKSTHQHHDVVVAPPKKNVKNYMTRAFPKKDNDSKKEEPKYVRE